MRLCVLLALFLSYSFPVHSILADDAYQSDWHFPLLGVPDHDNTFFHRPSTASNASLLYTISKRGILGAINPKDGTLVWRQSLADLSLPLNAELEKSQSHGENRAQQDQDRNLDSTKLLAHEGGGSVYTHFGSRVSSWDSSSGRLIWQWRAPYEQIVQSTQLVVSKGGKGSASSIDLVVLLEREAGNLVKLDGSSGAVIWEQSVER